MSAHQSWGSPQIESDFLLFPLTALSSRSANSVFTRWRWAARGDRAHGTKTSGPSLRLRLRRGGRRREGVQAVPLFSEEPLTPALSPGYDSTELVEVRGEGERPRMF